MKHFFVKLWLLLFPPKCVLCRALLAKDETDLCHDCRRDTAEFSHNHIKLPHLAHWHALWYYEDKVRHSLLRYKFCNCRSYGATYGRLLAMKLHAEEISFDILTWVPISAQRKRVRGYDQVELFAEALAQELQVPLTPTLRKIRNTPAQSTMGNVASRRANVLNAYHCICPEAVAGKRILLLDDVITTGATAGECARVLLSAGASRVSCAAIAAANHQSISR
jgi:ComF family protein